VLAERMQAARDAGPSEQARLLAGLRRAYRLVERLADAAVLVSADSEESP
jgi:hypothetical protein